MKKCAIWFLVVGLGWTLSGCDAAKEGLTGAASDAVRAAKFEAEAELRKGTRDMVKGGLENAKDSATETVQEELKKKQEDEEKEKKDKEKIEDGATEKDTEKKE